MFDSRAVASVNNFLTNEANNERTEKFKRVFTRIERHTRNKTSYVASTVYDKSFHIASIYCSGLLTMEGVNRVATWLTSASQKEIEEFKEVIGILKCSIKFSRPVSHTHSEFHVPPRYKVDHSLQRTSRQVVEDQEYVKSLERTRSERGFMMRREQEKRKEKERQDDELLQAELRRPSTAPPRRDVQATKHKPFATDSFPVSFSSTNTATFTNPNLRVSTGRPSSASSTMPPKRDPFAGQKMSFIPKAIMTTAVMGQVVPISDTSYIPFKEYEKYNDSPKLQQTKAEKLKRASPAVSNKLGQYLNRTMYSQQFSHSKAIPVAKPIINNSAGKSPYGEFPTVGEFSKTSEYRVQYPGKEDKYSDQAFDKRKQEEAKKKKRHHRRRHHHASK